MDKFVLWMLFCSAVIDATNGTNATSKPTTVKMGATQFPMPATVPTTQPWPAQAEKEKKKGPIPPRNLLCGKKLGKNTVSVFKSALHYAHRARASCFVWHRTTCSWSRPSICPADSRTSGTRPRPEAKKHRKVLS